MDLGIERRARTAAAGARATGPRIGRVSAARSSAPVESAERPSGVTSGLGIVGRPSPHGLVGIGCGASLVWGLLNRDGLSLAAEDGVGYALGIIGLACMLLLLGYSVRKRVGVLRNAGPMSLWLEIHLILGLLGPTAILFHSRFDFGSRNATIAMACMLAVAGSGVGGRFVYGRLHRGLAGPRRTVESLRRNATQELAPIQSLFDEAPAARGILERFAASAFGPNPWWRRALRVWIVRPYAAIAWRRTARALYRDCEEGRRLRKSAIRRVLRSHFYAQCRAVELTTFERIFALWHAVHVPLCVILFASAAIHVMAVHLY